MSPMKPPADLSRPVGIAIMVIGVVVVAGALNVAAIATLPIVASLLLCMLLWPIRRRLSRVTWDWLAAAACTGVLIVALGAVTGWAWYAADSAAEEFVSSQERYIREYRQAREWLVGIGVPESSVPRIQNNDDGRNEDVGEMFRMFGRDVRAGTASVVVGGLKSAAGLIAAMLLTVFLTFLALYEGSHWDGWARERLSRDRYDTVRDLVGAWSSQTRWYLLGKTATGIISGLATGLWLWAMGVPLAFVWGVFTFFMNFIPNVGALISGLPPTLLAVVHLGWGQGLIVGAGLVVIEMGVGSLIDPLFQGRVLKLSAWVVLASLIFWGWMWGLAGAMMAPILTAAAIVTVIRLRHPSTRG